MANRDLLRFETVENRLVIDENFLPSSITAPNTLQDVLANGNTTGGIDINGGSSNIETNTLKAVNLQPLGFPIVDGITVQGNFDMANNTNIDFGTEIDIKRQNETILTTDNNNFIIKKRTQQDNNDAGTGFYAL
jgi:hypothetical protein